MDQNIESPDSWWKKPSYWAILLFVLASAIVTFTRQQWKDKQVIQSDVLLYYEILPATFLRDDPFYSFVDTVSYDKQPYVVVKDSISQKGFSKMTLGVAYMYVPVFLITWGYAKLSGLPVDDFAPCFHFAVAFSTLLFAWIGLWFIRKVIRRFSSELSTTLILIVIGFGTGYWHCTVMAPGYGHVFSAALVAIYVWCNIRYRETQRLNSLLWMCFTLGLITLIRPTNILIVIWTIFWVPDKGLNLTEIVSFWWKRIPKLMLGGLVFIFPIVPQLLYWKCIFSSMVAYSYGDEGFFFKDPHVWNGLFSFRNGLFIYSPILLLCFPGFVFLWKRDKALFAGTSIFVVLNAYVIYSWWCWWYGGSFGSRPQIDSLVITALPIAMLFDWVTEKKRLKLLTMVIVGLFSGFSVFQSYQAEMAVLHWDSMTPAMYGKIFGRLELPYDAQYLIKYPDYEGAKKGKEYPIIVDEEIVQGEFPVNVHVDYPFWRDVNPDSIAKKGVTKLYTVMYYNPDSNFNQTARMVMAVESEEGVTEKMEVFELNNPYVRLNEWNVARLEMVLPDKLLPTDKLKCYIYNPSHQKMMIKKYRLRNF